MASGKHGRVVALGACPRPWVARDRRPAAVGLGWTSLDAHPGAPARLAGRRPSRPGRPRRGRTPRGRARAWPGRDGGVPTGPVTARTRLRRVEHRFTPVGGGGVSDARPAARAASNSVPGRAFARRRQRCRRCPWSPLCIALRRSSPSGRIAARWPFAWPQSTAPRPLPIGGASPQGRKRGGACEVGASLFHSAMLVIGHSGTPVPWMPFGPGGWAPDSALRHGHETRDKDRITGVDARDGHRGHRLDSQGKDREAVP